MGHDSCTTVSVSCRASVPTDHRSDTEEMGKSHVRMVDKGVTPGKAKLTQLDCIKARTIAKEVCYDGRAPGTVASIASGDCVQSDVKSSVATTEIDSSVRAPSAGFGWPVCSELSSDVLNAAGCGENREVTCKLVSLEIVWAALEMAGGDDRD